MLIYSVIFPIFSLIAIGLFYIRFSENKTSLSSFILWTIMWIFVIIFSIFPNVSLVFAKAFGITRGLDFIIIVALVLLFYLAIKLYLKIDKLQENMNTIVKEVALNNEIHIEEEEE